MILINYFFEIVMSQLIKNFKETVKDVPYFLLSEVLISNKNYEKEVKKIIGKSNEVSKNILEEAKLSTTN